MSARLGLMIAPDRVVAVEVRPTPRGARIATRVEYPLAAGPVDGGWPELTGALQRILAEVGGVSEASVALHRSFAQAKGIALPRLPRAELRGLLSRHARRYFLSAAEQSLADAVQEGRARAGTPVPALAAQAGTMAVEAVLAALEEVGLRCDAVTPASCALADAAWVLVPASRSAPVVILACQEGTSEGIVLRHRRVVAVETQAGLPAAELGGRAQRLVEAAIGSLPAGRPLRVLLLSDGDQEAARAALAGTGCSLLALPPETGATDPAALAAFGATQATARTPLTVPERVWERERATERMRIAGLALVACVLLGAAAAAHLWGLRRELATVVEERRAHARAVGLALAIQEEIEAVRSRLDQVRRAEADGTHWSRVLATVAQTLPDSAFLTAFTADSGQVRLDGVAPAASSVASALSVSTVLRDVTLVSAFRSPGSEEVERFALTMAVKRLPAPAAGASPGVGP